MREIKFRVFDKEKKEMCPVVRLTWPITESAELSELMMFTGLLDCKGNEIYESDLIQWFIKSEPGHFDLKVTVEVTIDPLKGTRPFSDPAYNITPNGCEVIGNIYEQPELVEE